MTEEQRIFERFPDFIREFIYSHSWDELRHIQIEAARVIFDTKDHLLLTSSTASGKTEAAFFPILSELCEHPSYGIRVLYIAPLKSLINDQFERMEDLLRESGIEVTRWHGDVSQSKKKKLLEDPRGILQITPESLEAMLINRSNDIVRLFGGLEFVVIDEIHTLVGSDRGNQVLCQLCRIERLIGRVPRRIGLSATVGDTSAVASWLSSGTDAAVQVPSVPEQRLRWRLGLEHFFIENDEREQSVSNMSRRAAAPKIDAGYEYMYDMVRDKKSLVFSNSREETEYVTATLRQIARNRGERDIFLIHHGNLSAPIREEAEAKMKDEGVQAVTCATVTLELGVDIGRLERVVQNESPNSVSSFLQRLGRSGRRGSPPEMVMVFREEDPIPNTPLPQLIPWDLIKGIAIIQLYIEERFIETPARKKLPLSLLFHQTLSTLAASGELTAKRLAERVLSMPPFSDVDKEIYRELLVSMINNDLIEMTEEKGLIVGLSGERLLRSFKFYAVFKDSEDYTVRCGSDEIGTITTPPPVGDRFALAGRVWEVEELDIPRKLIYVKSVLGKMQVSWPGDNGEIDTRILKRMKQVLLEDTEYPYLQPNARARLADARSLVRNTGMDKRDIVHLGGYTYCLFPWLGTRSFRTLRRFVQKNAYRLGITSVESDSCNYMTFKMERGNEDEFISVLRAIVEREGIDKYSLVGSGEDPVYEKYDDYIPAALLRRAYAEDRLRSDEAEETVLSWK